MGYAFAPVHETLFEKLEDQSNGRVIAMVFRGGGKSSICTTAFPLWAILGVHQAKHVLIVSRTTQQAQQHLENIKIECESNPFLKKDFGEVFQKETPWNATSLTFSKVRAQVTAVSSEQSMRGIRYGASRPDIIILDDVEDIASVKTKESRDKLFDWFTGDLLPAGNENTRLIVVGNNLHNDSLLNRLIARADNGQMEATIIRQPIMNEDGSSAWTARFPDQDSLEAYRRTIPSDRAWQQEMMLQPTSPEDQIIQEEWIHYYDELPEDGGVTSYFAIGIDLAISQKSMADKTAMIRAVVHGTGHNMKIYILPYPVNKQLTGAQGVESAMNLVEESKGKRTRVFVESVAYQKIFVELLRSNGVRDVYEYQPGSMSKEDRLMSIASLIEEGRVVFPKAGAQFVIDQTVGFGVEKYDDLVDALTTLVIGVTKLNPRKTKVGMTIGNFVHAYTSEEMEKARHDTQVDRKATDEYIAYHRHMNEIGAKEGLAWDRHGGWRAISPPPVPPANRQSKPEK